jgi:glycogen debranching enzyme
MNFTENLVLKENYTFLVADEAGMVESGERGIYNRDTRFLSRYCWAFSRPAQTLLAWTPRPDHFQAHHAVIEGPSQLLGIGRRLELGAEALADTLTIVNTSLERQALTLTLEFASDFADLFEARDWFSGRHQVGTRIDGNAVHLEYQAADGLQQRASVRFSVPPTRLTEAGAGFELLLEPGASSSIGVAVMLESPLETDLPAISYADWSAGFTQLRVDAEHQAALDQAVEDLRALLLFTPQGPLEAAGIPWFVTAFGRDSLLSAFMLLPQQPEVARGTLRYLAARQGTKLDAFHAEAPGKILHEVRSGELARTGQIPFGRYDGTIDATPLFIVLLHETWRTTGDLALVRELQPNWEAALAWMQTDGDPDGDGFLEFAPPQAGQGLSVQSWKDSHDALSHADGRLASGAIAVSEVQGYAYAAYRAAADFYSALGEDDSARRWQQQAEALQQRFHEAFWIEPLQTYALALDGDKQPLAVLASDAGQLLWSGIVPREFAAPLVATLFSDALWSGWGVRTLGTDEVRYNPLSYHNGSVWPHDTALIAGGLARYGFSSEARRIRNALFDLAASQADLRPPELIGGYGRTDAPPVPYPVACRPQAWAAAALVYLAALLPAEGES